MGLIKTHLDTSNLTPCLQALAQLTGRDYRDVVRSETEAILSKAVSNTPAASVELINKTKSERLRAQKLAARGLQKKVFVQIGDKLGLSVDRPAYVDRATAPGGDYPEDAHGKETVSGKKFSVDCQADRYYDPNVFSALAKAVNGRAGFFRRNMRAGVFKSVETIARKYPGLTASVDVNG